MSLMGEEKDFYLLVIDSLPTVSNKIILNYSIKRSTCNPQTIQTIIFNVIAIDDSFVCVANNDTKSIIVRDIVV